MQDSWGKKKCIEKKKKLKTLKAMQTNRKRSPNEANWMLSHDRVDYKKTEEKGIREMAAGELVNDWMFFLQKRSFPLNEFTNRMQLNAKRWEELFHLSHFILSSISAY